MTSGESASSGRTLGRRRWRSLTTTDKIAPIHPGEVLMEDFIEGFGITQNRLAVSIGVPPRRINEIVHGKRAITADTALRLGKYFGTSAQFWLNLQSHYDLDLAEDRAAEQIDAIIPLQSA
ncbi:MAG: HigA family addiction module antidote protein [Mycobacterium sp.]|nr:HigA family addiction module antidote protein [Mycobacterium sp.]